MRLDKCLEKAGIGSRRQVKFLFRTGQITVDGRPALALNQIVDVGLQEIVVSGRKVEGEGAVYYLLHKPAGVVSAVSDGQHQTVLDLLAPADRKEGLYPVGRLDRDTEGLILLTNNGPLGFRMLHPKHHVSKTYYVEVNGLLEEEAVTFFAKGVVFLDGRVCQPAQLTILQSSKEGSRALLCLSEGKFHQVKKMFLAYGVKVTFLRRTGFAAFQLGDLPVGHYRRLSREEEVCLKTYFTLED